MAGTTPTGYHNPIGSDPLEPATALTRLTDPTDEGILARSIEVAHPRGYAQGAPPVTADDYLAFGSVTTSLDSATWYTGSAAYGRADSNTSLTIGELGEYSIYLIAAATDASSTFTLYLPDGEQLDATGVRARFSAVFRVTSLGSNKVRVYATSPTGFTNIVRVHVRRLGPVL